LTLSSSRLSHSSDTLSGLLLCPQYREWFKDRYKENHFNDEEDIRALLWQKSQAISESIATATATAAQLATSNT
jgi:hypothetical protein